MEKNVSDLELKLRIVKGEIKESKKEKEKNWDILLTIIFSFVGVIAVGVYYFFIKKEKGLSEIILSVFLLLFLPILGFYWYNRYKKACQKIEKLERELYLLKKGSE